MSYGKLRNDMTSRNGSPHRLHVLLIELRGFNRKGLELHQWNPMCTHHDTSNQFQISNIKHHQTVDVFGISKYLKYHGEPKIDNEIKTIHVLSITCTTCNAACTQKYSIL